MITKKSNNIRRLSTVFIFGIFLTSCIFSTSNNPNAEGDQPAPSQDLPVPDSHAARDAALRYIRDHYGFFVPTSNQTWIEEDITPEGIVGSAGAIFTSGSWTISAIYPTTAPENTVYTIILTNPGLSLLWEGQVDALGNVTETSASTEYVEEGAASQEITATPSTTPTPRKNTLEFIDDFYRLRFEYPSHWLLSTAPAGQTTSTGAFAAKTIKLIKGGITIKLQYKLLWEPTELGSGLPPGELQVRDPVILLDQQVPQHAVVQNGKDILVFFGNSVDDISYHFRLETTGDEITQEAIEVAAKVAASIERTGEIYPSPTPSLTPSVTPEPSPTSKFASSMSGAGTGTSENCNLFEFISDQSHEEGAKVPPGVQFIKIWRVQNAGICTWNSSYSFAFSDGDDMGSEGGPLLDEDEEVLPGEIVNISLELRAPDDEGDYASYWVLNDPGGSWFGWGGGKRGLLEADIEVVEFESDYDYDFALDYCDAAWSIGGVKGDEEVTEELECPNGNVALLTSPNMEHGRDDELTLQVHPYDSRYGWIQGRYPRYTVQAGDEFKALVGCMADMQLCSLEFRLHYIDDDGTKHLIDTWFEAFDGKISKVDVELDFLAGKSVRFVLETVAMTENTHRAYGFWFVPRIERP
jgi:hypothetical protein